MRAYSSYPQANKAMMRVLHAAWGDLSFFFFRAHTRECINSTRNAPDAIPWLIPQKCASDAFLSCLVALQSINVLTPIPQLLMSIRHQSLAIEE